MWDTLSVVVVMYNLRHYNFSRTQSARETRFHVSRGCLPISIRDLRLDKRRRRRPLLNSSLQPYTRYTEVSGSSNLFVFDTLCCSFGQLRGDQTDHKTQHEWKHYYRQSARHFPLLYAGKEFFDHEFF